MGVTRAWAKRGSQGDASEVVGNGKAGALRPAARRDYGYNGDCGPSYLLQWRLRRVRANTARIRKQA